MYINDPHPEIAPGIKVWTNKNNKFRVVMLHYSADPDKNPATETGKLWYEAEKQGTPKADWLKEREIDFTTRAGKLIYGSEFCDFDPGIHLINSFELGNDVEFLLGLDFGQRNPTAALVGAWTREGRLYIIDEYYKPALPSVSTREMFKQFSYIIGDTEGKTARERRIMADNAFQVKVIDPTTRSKNRSKMVDYEEIQYSIIEEFYDHGLDFEPGNNDVKSGINRVREYMQLDDTGKPRLYIFKDKCPHLTWEIQRYKYRELTEVTEKTNNESEEPVKKDDHAPDALRYLLMTRPYIQDVKKQNLTKIQQDIRNLCRPKIELVNDFDIG